MTVHDDEWDMPYARFGPTSSYNAPVVPPSVEPDGGTLVQIPCIAKEWLPLVLGALDQLRLPSTWEVADDDAMLLTLQRVANLRDLIAQWGACEVLAFRCEPGDDQSPQYSTDGGVTWIDLPDCFIGPPGPPGAPGAAGATGATGATGAAGGYTPPVTPPNPLGTATAQLGCNIAGYLSNAVIQASLNQAAASVTAGQTDANFATALLGILFVADPIVDLALLAGDALFHAVTSGTLADYNAAAADASLWSRMTCAIYSAISGAGYVTAANYAAVLSNIAAVSYAHPAVITAISNYVSTLGLTGLRQLQTLGAVAVYDCSACSTPPSAPAIFLDNSGSGGKITLANDLVAASGFTFGGWFGGFDASVNQWLFMAGLPAGVIPPFWQLYIATSDHKAYVNWVHSSGSQVTATGGPALTTGPYHIAFTVSGTALTLYVDGVSVATAVLPAGPFNSAGGVSSFGSNPGGGKARGVFWRWFCCNGTALTAAQILAWRNAGHFGAAPPGATNAWIMDENSGTTVHDTIGGNTGTMSSSASWSTHN